MIDDGSVALQLVPPWGPSTNAKLTVLDGKLFRILVHEFHKYLPFFGGKQFFVIS